jgi:hypothetical protein
MTFYLTSENALPYLIGHSIMKPNPESFTQVSQKSGKNFNLLLSILPEGQNFLVKQERFNLQGETSGEFWYEWALQEFLEADPKFDDVRKTVSKIFHFNPKHSILVLSYQDDYSDLTDFYAGQQLFPVAVAGAIGELLAACHRVTSDRTRVELFFSQQRWEGRICIDRIPSIFRGLQRISPDVFTAVRTEGIDFFRLFQRYNLAAAIAKLEENWKPRCLIHNDLRFPNFLLHQNWQSLLNNPSPGGPSALRIIDWEKFTWGDPAFDLGTVIAAYLELWLGSVILHPDIEINVALSLATTPLEHVQPSLRTLVSTYFTQYPELYGELEPFMTNAIQLAGTVVVQKLITKLDRRNALTNSDLCLLHAAKTMICDPAQSIATIFGVPMSDLLSSPATAH